MATPQGLHLAGVTTAYALGDVVGAVRSGPACGESSGREWSELLQRRVQAELSRAFKAELAKAPAVVAGDVAVTARLNDLKMQLCDLGQGAWQGGFEVHVSWQIKRHDGAQQVLQASTSGRFKHLPGEAGIRPDAALRAAFAQTVRQLLAAPQFAAATQAPADAERHVAQATGL